MNWPLLLPLVISTVVAILGWYAGNLLNSWRDTKNKRREVRIPYLITAYRILVKRCDLPPGEHLELGLEIESALSDIQLFGTAEQIREAKRFAEAEEKKILIPMNDLLNTFRNDLRGELGLPHIKDPVWNLRYGRTQTNPQKE